MTERYDESPDRETEPQTLVEAVRRTQEVRLPAAEPVEPVRSMEEAPGALSQGKAN